MCPMTRYSGVRVVCKPARDRRGLSDCRAGAFLPELRVSSFELRASASSVLGVVDLPPLPPEPSRPPAELSGVAVALEEG